MNNTIWLTNYMFFAIQDLLLSVWIVWVFSFSFIPIVHTNRQSSFFGSTERIRRNVIKYVPIAPARSNKNENSRAENIEYILHAVMGCKIHPSSLAYSIRVTVKLVPSSGFLLVKGRVCSGEVASLSKGSTKTDRDTHPCTQ